MASPKKKRKPSLKPSPVLPPTPGSTPITSLPDDLLLSCLAYVSRLHYPTLSLVSKRFRSLLTSPEIYKARSLLGRTKSCLYLCLEISPESNQRWFTLYRKPDQTLTNDTRKKKKKKEKSSGYILAKLPITHAPRAYTSGLVSVGSNIYTIGGPINDSASASVSILDCRSHTWHESPSMRMKRNFPAANVLDGKIYVAGGCNYYNSSNWMEVFDPNTRTWELVSNTPMERCTSILCKSALIEGKIYMFSMKGVAYEPKEDRWEEIRELTFFELGWSWLQYCVIDNILYSYKDLDGIEWYDSTIRNWVVLKGLKTLPKYGSYKYVKLVDYGGKMAVLWDDYFPSSEDRKIWCAVIVLERRNMKEIWGKVEWVDVVLKVPNSYTFVSALSAMV